MEVYSGDKPLTSEERKKLKEILLKNRGPAYIPGLVEKFGAHAGLFISQLLYWEGKGHNPDGWIYKSEKEMQEETGLTRSAQRKARKVLVGKGVMEEELRGLPRRLWYRSDLQALMTFLDVEPPSDAKQGSAGFGDWDDIPF